MKKENIAGRKYNMLKVIEDTGEIRVLCQCDCGTIKKVNRWHLMSGRIKSCGCLNRKQTAARLSEMRQNGRKKWLNNHTANKNNKTGVKGVCFNERQQMYIAYLTRNGKRIFFDVLPIAKARGFWDTDEPCYQMTVLRVLSAMDNALPIFIV